MSTHTNPFPILLVPDAARGRAEPMGTKEKFWWEPESTRYLFKFARPGTGEHWSEKLASELAMVLGVPCASVELATFHDRPGCAVRTFLRSSASLVHGNELLQEKDDSYPVATLRGVSKHTVSAVLIALKDVEPPAGADSPIGAADWFVGYLLLDAIILNSDRHHENWAVLQRSDGSRQLAPSYDHASSLGRELKDSERSARLTGKDPRHTVETYVARARSALYGDPSDARPLHPADAFLRALELQPSAADHWLDKVKTLSLDAFTTLVDRVPPELMSDPARAFGVDVVQESLALLLRRLRSET